MMIMKGKKNLHEIEYLSFDIQRIILMPNHLIKKKRTLEIYRIN